MRNTKIVRNTIRILFQNMIWILMMPVLGQNTVPEVVRNVSYSIMSNKMLVVYDLEKVGDWVVYDVTLKISTDGGLTYFSPNAVTGDVGKKIHAGKHNITWDIFADRDELEGNVKVRVTAIPNAPYSEVQSTPPVARKENVENKDGFFCFFGYPTQHYSNDVFQDNLNDSLLIPGPRFTAGVRLTTKPWIIESNYTKIKYNVTRPVPLHSKYNNGFMVLDSAICQSEAGEFMIGHLIFAKVPKVDPYLGLGYQFSAISLTHDDEDGWDYDHIDQSYRSGAFAFASLSLANEYVYLDATYKYGLPPGETHWNQVLVSLGLKWWLILLPIGGLF